MTSGRTDAEGVDGILIAEAIADKWAPRWGRVVGSTTTNHALEVIHFETEAWRPDLLPALAWALFARGVEVKRSEDGAYYRPRTG
jgi:hypothetical protein